MVNPILSVLNSRSPLNNAAGGMNPGSFPMAKLLEFAKLMRGRNPQQILGNLIRQNGITDSQYQEAAAMATQICQMFGLK